MRAAPTLIKLLFKAWMRSKQSIFFGFLFPVMLLLIFGSVFGGPSPPNYTLYVRNLDVDQSGKPGALSEAFIRALNESVFEVHLLRPDDPAPRGTGFAAVRILTIPKGFTENLLNVTVANRLEITADTILRMVAMAGESIPPQTRAEIESSVRAIRSYRQTIGGERPKLTLEGSPDDRLLQPIEGIINVIASKFELALLNASSAMEVNTVLTQTKQLRLVDYYLPGYVAAFVMTNGLIGVSLLVFDAYRRGLVKLLASTPLPKSTWIASIVVVQTIVSLILLGVMLAVGWAVFRISAFPDALSLLVILLGTLAFTGFGVAIGGSLREAGAVTALANSVAFPMMFLSGALWPLELMPEFLQAVARFTPLYYFHVALREALIVGSPAGALLPTLVVAGLAALGLSLAVVATKWKDF